MPPNVIAVMEHWSSMLAGTCTKQTNPEDAVSHCAHAAGRVPAPFVSLL